MVFFIYKNIKYMLLFQDEVTVNEINVEDVKVKGKAKQNIRKEKLNDSGFQDNIAVKNISIFLQIFIIYNCKGNDKKYSSIKFLFSLFLKVVNENVENSREQIVISNKGLDDSGLGLENLLVCVNLYEERIKFLYILIHY